MLVALVSRPRVIRDLALGSLNELPKLLLNWLLSILTMTSRVN